VTITIEIKPETEAALAAQATARGMDVPTYASTLLEGAVQPNRQRTLSEFLMESPLAGSGINLERDKDPGRTIEL
jgi:hypothetical protein